MQRRLRRSLGRERRGGEEKKKNLEEEERKRESSTHLKYYAVFVLCTDSPSGMIVL